jgi:alanine racemase
MGGPARAADLSPGRLTIDLGAIARNWQALDKISAGALTGAVIKANAYGTGLRAVAPVLFAAGARFFFVATPDEALCLREALPGSHIFVLNGLWPGAAPIYAQARIMPVLNTIEMVEEWLGHCVEKGEAFPAAIHFDTGMNRLGHSVDEIPAVLALLARAGYAPQMIMSHLACADLPEHDKNRQQLSAFKSVATHFPDIPASIANSAATMAGRPYHLQLVRPGIALFGGRAIAARANPMAPVVSLEVPILQVRTVRAGEAVGYGAVHSFDREAKLAILPLGYGDGLLRAMGSATTYTGARFNIAGTRVPVVGRISMDLVAIDITEVPEGLAVPGRDVEILGANVGIDDLADAADTIGYEILTALNGRYQRFYVNDIGMADGS